MTRTISSLPRSGGMHQATPTLKPKPVFARDDAAGMAKEPATPARILIVEDDFLVAVDVETALLDAGFHVVGVAESAERAVELAALQKPTLILMDIRLAGGSDGIDAAIRIYREQGIRCVFASAHTDTITRSRAEAARPLGWLQKPYTMGGLIDAVKQGLSNKSDQS